MILLAGFPPVSYASLISVKLKAGMSDRVFHYSSRGGHRIINCATRGQASILARGVTRYPVDPLPEPARL
ncbi:hypothetical protein BQ8482_130112 [Mesorhizobium delmotii]|uniref:Uncharacterized protein n=1 Tax=Mesorhizobium delmotii TaxID=1631247 RepID=A0A2P9AGE0_9HYPH|nr:hypothetical protein BQ8482_130112 [Mesorhizobium delmotii]